MRKNTTTSLLKACILESLLLLLQDKPIEAVSILEIVQKAGVNRSTYYRHFKTKQDVVRFFYETRLDESLESVAEEYTLEQYFTEIFTNFLKYKKELLLLDRLSLSHLLLDEMNARIVPLCDSTMDPVQRLYCNYHIGGVFNSFRYWLREGMTIPPQMLARQCVAILPEDFSPRLLRR